MISTEWTKAAPRRPLPNGDPPTRGYLDDLPATPKILEGLEVDCRTTGLTKPRHRESFLRDLKLLFYFPGKDVAYQRTERGVLLLKVAEPGAEEMDAFLAGLPEDERRAARLRYVPSDEDRL